MRYIKLLSLLAALVFTGCGPTLTQTPLQGIAGGIDQLKINQFSEQWRVWAEEALKHADTMALDPIQMEQAKSCSGAILLVQGQKQVMMDRWKAHLLKLDEQLQSSFNPIILAQEIKFGTDAQSLIRDDEKEIIGWGEYLLHSCSNLFPTDKAIDIARKFFGGGL
jgi:hypothetical protein